MKTKIRETKEKHRDILQTHLNKIKQKQESMKKDLLQLRDITKSNEVSQTLEYSSKISTFSLPPTNVEIILPTFTSKPIDRERLFTLFGQITPLSIETFGSFLPYQHVLSANKNRAILMSQYLKNKLLPF